MAVKLKRVDEQTIVITGASSGIGLATARMAAKKGARLVLAARSGDALTMLVAEIASAGGHAIAVEADVGSEEDVHRISDRAIEAFGGYDTWVNNAGVSIYGELTTVPVADMRKLFETNYWGTVYGALAAVEHLRGRGGALINIGSTLSERAVPLQGAYSASKHAVKGFTDALRMELEHDGAPISVTLVKPGPIDTPYPHHAKNYLDEEPTHAPPVYAAETVARAILHAAETPTRDVYVGAGAKMLPVMGELSGKVADKVMGAIFFDGSKSGHEPRPLDDNGLDHPRGELEQSGGYEGFVQKVSLYTEATLNPAKAAAIVGAGAAAVAVRRMTRSGGQA